MLAHLKIIFSYSQAAQCTLPAICSEYYVLCTMYYHSATMNYACTMHYAFAQFFPIKCADRQTLRCHYMYTRVFHKNTFFGNSCCTKLILGPGANTNLCQKMCFSNIYFLPLKLDPLPNPPIEITMRNWAKMRIGHNF